MEISFELFPQRRVGFPSKRVDNVAGNSLFVENICQLLILCTVRYTSARDGRRRRRAHSMHAEGSPNLLGQLAECPCDLQLSLRLLPCASDYREAGTL